MKEDCDYSKQTTNRSKSTRSLPTSSRWTKRSGN